MSYSEQCLLTKEGFCWFCISISKHANTLAVLPLSYMPAEVEHRGGAPAQGTFLLHQVMGGASLALRRIPPCPADPDNHLANSRASFTVLMTTCPYSGLA